MADTIQAGIACAGEDPQFLRAMGRGRWAGGLTLGTVALRRRSDTAPFMHSYQEIGSSADAADFHAQNASSAVGGPADPLAAVPYVKTCQDIEPSADAAALRAQNAELATGRPADPLAAVPFVKFIQDVAARRDESIAGLPEEPNDLNQPSSESSLVQPPIAGSTVPRSSQQNPISDDSEVGGIHEVLRAIVQRMDAIDRPPAYATEI